jgi:predicted DNA-binding transcriptional regulator AlpA
MDTGQDRGAEETLRHEKSMSEPGAIIESVLESLLRRIVREEITAIVKEMSEQDRLLDAEEAAKVLGVSPEWLYRNAKRLPFSNKLGHKMLRFSCIGIQKYLAVRKPV